VGVTVLGLVIGSARNTDTPARDSASSRPPAAALMARATAAVTAAATRSVLQMIVTTPQGVSRSIIDDPGQATELVHNRAGGTMSERALRKLPGPARRFQSRTVNFAAGNWSQAVLADAPGNRGGTVIETPAQAIAAQLHHQIGVHSLAPATRARAARATTIDGQRAYALVLTGPGGPPATVWISKSTWLPVRSASPGVIVSYEWTAPRTIRAATLWPEVPPGLARIPPE
jgi:hypothetical protein